MKSLFEDLKTGLEEAINFEKGISQAKETTYVIKSVKDFSANQVTEIQKTGLHDNVQNSAIILS